MLQIVVAQSLHATLKKDPEDLAAEDELWDVLRWAENQGFFNIAEVLRRVLNKLYGQNP